MITVLLVIVGALSNSRYFGHNLESSEPVYKLPNCRKGVKDEFLKERPKGPAGLNALNSLYH